MQFASYLEHINFLLVFLLTTTATGSAVLSARDGPCMFNLTLTWDLYAPDGGETREMILVNGQYPGPVLEINQGNDVVVTVHNQMPFNTTVHFHGIEMYLTPWSDGTPGLSQRLIQPGKSFPYRWTATQYGSYWYHAHEAGQLDDGLYGPIVIHPTSAEPAPWALISSDNATMVAIADAAANAQPLVLSDWRQVTSAEAWQIETEAGIEIPCYDAVLVNGKGQIDCWSAAKMASLTSPAQEALLAAGEASSLTAKGCLPAAVLAKVYAAGTSTNLSTIPPSIFDVCTPTNGSVEIVTANTTSNTWLALNLVGAFGLLTATFSIDEHQLYVYAVDGSYITPQLVDAISITPGARYSVLVNTSSTPPGDYTIRIASTILVQLLAGYAIFRVTGSGMPLNGASTPSITDGGTGVSPSITFFSESSMKAFPPMPVSPTADAIFILHMRISGRGYLWALNTTVFPSALSDSATPLLFAPPLPPGNDGVIISTLNGTWVDLVFVADQPLPPMPPHPVHKHGNKMFLLGAGVGPWTWETVAAAVASRPSSFNLVDPPRRDGFATAAGNGWMVVRYRVVNPGAWLLHCHVESHLVGGMAVAIQDGVDAWPVMPEEYLGY